MPILYIHGVNVRNRQGFEALTPFLRRYVAQALTDDADKMLIDDFYWGDLAFQPAFAGISRPRTRLLGMGADGALSPAEAAIETVSLPAGIRRFAPAEAASPSTGGLGAGGAMPTTGSVSMPVRLVDLTSDELGDLVAAAILQTVDDQADRTQLVLAADEVARDAATHTKLAATATTAAQLDLLIAEVRTRAAAETGLAAAGALDWFPRLRDRLQEGLDRARSAPTYAASIALSEFRGPVNEVVSRFLGDVFHYLNTRGTAQAPGPIPALLLDKLRAAHRNKIDRGEPLVIFTHSMGGQLLYDAITHFVPGTPDLADLQVDFWCASASQVGFFEEARLFLASSDDHGTGKPVPFPTRHLGVWWNVWDHNDVLSFTTKDIIAGVDDERFDSGLSLLQAHGGYPMRPTFYRAFAKKLEAAKNQGWRTM